MNLLLFLISVKENLFKENQNYECIICFLTCSELTSDNKSSGWERRNLSILWYSSYITCEVVYNII